MDEEALEEWFQNFNNQPLPNQSHDDYNVDFSPTTVDAIYRELSQRPLTRSTDTSLANQTITTPDEHRISQLEENAVKTLLNYVLGLEPWTKAVTEVIKGLGEVGEAPPSATQSGFMGKEG
ncbi:hypothetical protein ACJ73_03091 [Blastomyces percursus]|uniref:Uncharacterized protein n=1 Tax=Blastomyces percursus TaxID=1658174 RepID=A0A1J9QBT7_9EURO|nr:hypothetical protein ACJ73_03091 [Blastomyces percursus]